MSVDPFDEGVPRDRYGRPLIQTPDGVKAYTRVSTFCKALDDSHGLTTWKQRYLALGIAQNPDLAAMAAALQYGDPKLDEIIEIAHDRVGGNAKAHYGTAVHSFTEPGARLHLIPTQNMARDVDAYHRELNRCGITVIETERFVVNDDLQVAGTFDHIYNVPGVGNVIADKKTGTFHPQACAIQLGIYAASQFYDHTTGERTPLPDVSQARGLVVHIPAGKGSVELQWVNLQAGLDAAMTASDVRRYQARKDIHQPYAQFINAI